MLIPHLTKGGIVCAANFAAVFLPDYKYAEALH